MKGHSIKVDLQIVVDKLVWLKLVNPTNLCPIAFTIRFKPMKIQMKDFSLKVYGGDMQ